MAEAKKETEAKKTKEKEAGAAASEKKRQGVSRILGAKKEQAPVQKIVLAKDPYEILKFVLMTEKAVRQIELQNKLMFIVDRKAKKPEIRTAAEKAFNSPVYGVTTMIDQAGRKKASIRFKNAGAAGDIAVRLGII